MGRMRPGFWDHRGEGQVMDDYSLWDDPWYEMALGDTMRHWGKVIDDSYRLNSWTVWNRAQRAQVR